MPRLLSQHRSGAGAARGARGGAGGGGARRVSGWRAAKQEAAEAERKAALASRHGDTGTSLSEICTDRST